MSTESQDIQEIINRYQIIRESVEENGTPNTMQYLNSILEKLKQEENDLKHLFQFDEYGRAAEDVHIDSEREEVFDDYGLSTEDLNKYKSIPEYSEIASEIETLIQIVAEGRLIYNYREGLY